jgi:Lipase maturation factor
MNVLRQMIKFAPFIATIVVINVFLQSCISHPNVSNSRGFFAKLTRIIHLLALTLLAISLIGASTVPHGKLHPDTNIMNTSIGKAYVEFFNKYHIVHEYGLHLRKMRSERLELGIQYTDVEKLDKSKPKQWKEFYTTYRPSNLNHSLPYAGPYFSRIDFKFYEATGKGARFEKNLWLASLVKHLLRNSRPALQLLGQENLMKMKMPPKFVRIALMRVSYVPRTDSDKNAGFYTRKIMNKDYLPPMSLSSQELNDLIKKLNIPTKKEKEAFPQLISALKNARLFTEAADGHMIVNGILVASLVIMLRLRRY